MHEDDPKPPSNAITAETTETIEAKVAGALVGIQIGDALAMPAHWYYDRAALQRDYGQITDFMAPKSPHPDSILWRSKWHPPSPELDILGDQRPFWGQRGIHYHQNLEAGESTLTAKLAIEVWRSLQTCDGFDANESLQRYIDLLTHPERHGDTYLEECHRGFFTNLGRGNAPAKCAIEEKHVGGLTPMLAVALYYADQAQVGQQNALEQLALTHAGNRMRLAAEAVLTLLFRVLHGETLEEAIRGECALQRNPHFGFPYFKWLKKADQVVVGRHLSTACYVEGAVPSAIYLALKYSGEAEAGLIANTALGGDNVHRGSLLGALFGAECGVAGWPERWRGGLADSPIQS